MGNKGLWPIKKFDFGEWEYEYGVDWARREKPVGWVCENRHLDPDTGREFEQAAERDSCEICGRARPAGG